MNGRFSETQVTILCYLELGTHPGLHRSSQTTAHLLMPWRFVEQNSKCFPPYLRWLYLRCTCGAPFGTLNVVLSLIWKYPANHSALTSGTFITWLFTLFQFRRPLNLPDPCTTSLPTSSYHWTLSEHDNTGAFRIRPVLSIFGQRFLYLDVTCASPSTLCHAPGSFGDFPSSDRLLINYGLRRTIMLHIVCLGKV